MSNQTPVHKFEYTPEEIAVFPIIFSIEHSYRTANRLAGVWEACGLITEIRLTGAGYALILHHPFETE